MLTASSSDYGYANDDILTDVISSACMIACGLGEILGPLFSGFVADIIGIQNACNIVALLSFILAFAFAVGTGAVCEWIRKKNNGGEELLSKQEILAEDS